MLSACNGKSLDADLLTPKHIGLPVGKTKECQTDGRLLRKKVFMKTQDVRENGNERNIVMYISYALYFIT